MELREFSSGAVAIVKLSNGQELIAKVTDSSPTRGMVLSSPLLLQAVRDTNGVAIGLVPFSWGGLTQDVAIAREHILCALLPEPSLQNQYLASLAGLTLPTGNEPTTPRLTLVE
jgi:hypothetical protein